MVKKNLLVAFIMLMFCTFCKKTEEQVPQSLVNFSINISNPSYLALQAPGGWVYVSGGSMGIIIYRNSQTEFHAYDRHSPYQVQNRCRVEVDSNSFYVVDTCSNSQFLLTDGSPVSGPATRPLTSYETSFNQNRNVLSVSN